MAERSYTGGRMHRPVTGQRWISTSEPALGLGVVRSFDGHRVEVHYPAAEEKRIYAFDSAPIVRVSFGVGDLVADNGGNAFHVEKVSNRGELLTYHSGDTELSERDLLNSLGFVTPEKRLLAGLVDHPRAFEDRLQALEWNSRLRQSPARGFAGGRIDLIPHQLAIVSEISGRLHPRVLLADEVGLGKTIEACLILHRLHLTGRAERILILVPEPLIHQWFVELLRRFNLLFALFDEERCDAIETHDPEANPFLDSQLILAATGFLSENERRAAQAGEAGFDLLIVDEAHHLEWSPEAASAEYQVVESLAAEIPSLLLLTATPQQLGPAGHFARLRLLDPDRYSDLAGYLTETQAYAPLAEAVKALKAGDLPENLSGFTVGSPRAEQHLKVLQGGDESARETLISELIDSFGTGRVLFRNTRERLTGFPKRLPHLHPLAVGASPYVWLADLIRSLPEKEKVLLITSSPEAAIAVQEKLLARIQVESALFHEDLSLLQRDRNAAWFAERDGARILICSEIGSEGRNFQFARHLVLFGLPRDPELLEQRIGRLDRIGQTGDIHIHVPYGVGSASEYHARWLHEGLDAFTQPLKGATTLASKLLPELDALTPGDAEKFDELLDRSRKLKEQITLELTTGHDLLLKLGAPPASKAETLRAAIGASGKDTRFEKFSVWLFDHQGLDVSDLSVRTYHFHRGQRHSEAFAGLPEEGLSATYDRATALAREDIAFMTPDHPVFRDALEQLLESESGNASFAHWKTGAGKAIMLECVFVLESIAPTRLYVERFLPPTILRVMVDHQGKEVSLSLPSAQFQPGDPRRLVQQETFRRDLFPRMLKEARAVAEEMANNPLECAKASADEELNSEIARLTDLAKRNPQISEQEIYALRAFRDEILAALKAPRLRLDAVRLIWRT